MPRQATPGGMTTFIIIWFGQLVSIFGSGLTGFGLGVWVFQESGSATQFALTYFFYVMPFALVASLAGTLVDRWDRRWVMILADTGQALATLIIGLLLYAGQLAVWHIYALTIVSAVLGGFLMITLAASAKRKRAVYNNESKYERYQNSVILSFECGQSNYCLYLVH